MTSFVLTWEGLNFRVQFYMLFRQYHKPNPHANPIASTYTGVYCRLNLQLVYVSAVIVVSRDIFSSNEVQEYMKLET